MFEESESGAAQAQLGVLRAAKLIVALCATTRPSGTYSIAKVTREGDGYGDLCLLCTRHLPALQIAVEAL